MEATSWKIKATNPNTQYPHTSRWKIKREIETGELHAFQLVENETEKHWGCCVYALLWQKKYQIFESTNGTISKDHNKSFSTSKFSANTQKKYDRNKKHTIVLETNFLLYIICFIRLQLSTKNTACSGQHMETHWPWLFMVLNRWPTTTTTKNWNKIARVKWNQFFWTLNAW